MEIQEILQKLAAHEKIEFVENSTKKMFCELTQGRQLLNVLVKNANKQYQYVFGQSITIEDLNLMQIFFIYDALCILAKEDKIIIEDIIQL